MKHQRLAVLLLLCGSVAAQTTKTWEQSKFDDFEKGTSKGVAITSEGSLQLAPDLKSLVSTPSTFLWSAVSDSKGNLFTAGGSPARVYRVTTDGKITTVLSADELQVQALAIDKDGTVYAATNPDGKVYKISPVIAVKGKTPPAATPTAAPATSDKAAAVNAAEKKPAENTVANDPGYTASLFYDPKQKYIWALALDDAGRLYVGTGDRGEIHRVEKTGIGSVFFDSDEAHIRSMAFKGTDLIAGSDGSGLVYRISSDGKGFVLYSAPKKEITAIAINHNGDVYVAAAGDKKSTPGMLTPLSAGPAPAAGASHSMGGSPPAPTTTASAPPPSILLTGQGATGSEIYKISGAPTRVWTSREDLVYALAFDHNGRLLAGTGNRGKIYQVFDNGEFVDLQKASANQVIAFAPTNYGDLFAVTSNLGKVFLLQDATQREGTFDSDVFDARLFSRWGRVEARTTGNTELWARSGNVDNPDRNWSDWQRIDVARDAPITAPSSRFMQWRAVLHSGQPTSGLEYVRVNYLQENVAPIVDDVNVQVGAKFSAPPKTVADVIAASASKSTPFQPPQNTINDRDYIAISWTSRDENSDLLSYSIYYRGEGETRWQLLKDDLADRYYSFESNLLPDGAYTVMVVASDAPSHSPGMGLRSVGRQSSRFEIDNTPPAVTNLTGVAESGKLHIRFSTSDAMSLIKRAEFSVDAGDFAFLAPRGEITDSKNESYDFLADVPRANEVSTPESSDEHLVTVRVYDRADNMAIAKVVVKAAPVAATPPARKK